ncbi:unnamed protein product [Blepharisma stoltei]|uniref:RING-type domain-containing protein n=1 Tax=Blepharisma stoltei TaxID=1481888 RepID=A0AAU9KAL4_9CILI|nr:unnamed protein product [Blepharisma stoltei]
MVFLFIPILLLLTTNYTLGASIEIGSTQTISQTDKWNYFEINSSGNTQKYLRIWIQITSKPSGALPILAISNAYPTFGDSNTPVKAKYADYESYYSGLNYQSLFLQSADLWDQTWIGVWNDQSSQGVMKYVIGIDASDNILCPKDCSNNGDCISLGKCKCNSGFIGPSCDINAYEITKQSQKIENTQTGQDYAYINLDNISSGNIIFYFIWNNYPGKAILNFDGNTLASLPSNENPNNYLSIPLLKSSLTQKRSIDTSGMGNHLYFLFINNRQDSSYISYDVWYTEDSSSTDQLILIYIIVSSVGFLVLLAAIVLIVWKRYKKERARIVMESPGLASNLINKNYPAIKYQEIKNKKGLDTTCAICFEAFRAVSVVRRLHCKHLFHGTCIEEWFKANRTCCLCKRDCSVPEECELNTSTDELAFEKSGTRPLALRRISINQTHEELTVRDIQ